MILILFYWPALLLMIVSPFVTAFWVGHAGKAESIGIAEKAYQLELMFAFFGPFLAVWATVLLSYATEITLGSDVSFWLSLAFALTTGCGALWGICRVAFQSRKLFGGGVVFFLWGFTLLCELDAFFHIGSGATLLFGGVLWLGS